MTIRDYKEYITKENGNIIARMVSSPECPIVPHVFCRHWSEGDGFIQPDCPYYRKIHVTVIGQEYIDCSFGETDKEGK